MTNAIETSVGALVIIDGRECDYFAGCGYLGLQNHPELLAAAADALQRYGLGTATSRGGYGEHPVYVALEEMAARYFGAEAALYYVTAYLGNTILLQGLRGEYDRIFMDDASHFSVRDSVQIAGVPVTAFRHLDPDDLAAQLRGQLRPGERPLVISDGVFPISGEIAPAPDYLRALAAYPGAILCLDDAHATGVLGARGQGTAEYWKTGRDLPRFVPVWPGMSALISAHTLSKALGCHGGIIAGDAELIGKLRRTRPPSYVAHSPSPLPVARGRHARRWISSAASRSGGPVSGPMWPTPAPGCASSGWPLADTPVPIICLGARPGLDLARIQAELFERDICVAHVTRYSSTPAGGALRIAIFATHTEAQIDRLMAEIGRLL